MNKKTYILVHGAWHGSWCWHKVKERLIALGHTVITPDLPGHHAHPSSFHDVTLNTYVEHIENIIRGCDQPVVLVGHSMGGVVVTQVAENMPDKIECLIYISALIPENMCALTSITESSPTVSTILTMNEEDASITLNSPEKIRAFFYGQCDDEDVEFALRHVQAQPLLPFTAPIHISERFGSVRKYYVQCLQDQAVLPEDQKIMLERAACTPIALESDHSPFFSNPDLLINILISYI